MCVRRSSNKHLRLAEEKVEAGNNCHSPFRQRGGGRGSGEALIINWKGAIEGFFLNCDSHKKNPLHLPDGSQPFAAGDCSSDNPGLCLLVVYNQ